MSCLREGGESEEGGGGDRRSHGCHQLHPHYPADGAAEQRRHSSSHGHHGDAGGGGGGEVGGEGSSGWVRSRREVEVGSCSGGHGGGPSSGPSGTSLEVGGARRKVPQQVCSSYG